MAIFNLESCKYDFATDTINIFANIYDVSGSMESYTGAMRTANKAFYDDFSRFEERGSIAIAKGVFSERFDMSTFASVKEFNTGYLAYGSTALYEAIYKSAKNTIAYYYEIVKRLSVTPRVTYLVFSDGMDNASSSFCQRAKNLLQELNSMDATTVFVAFGEAIHSGIGEALGFSCIRNIETVQDLISCLGTELSQSCKEQSKSAFALKSEFFSKADKNAEEDNPGNQAIVDDDFFNI